MDVRKCGGLEAALGGRCCLLLVAESLTEPSTGLVGGVIEDGPSNATPSASASEFENMVTGAASSRNSGSMGVTC